MGPLVFLWGATARDAQGDAHLFDDRVKTWRVWARTGYVTIRLHFDHAAEFRVMAVIREVHRRGIGRALLEAAQAWFDGCS